MKEIVKKFEESPRLNKDLGIFIKEFSDYFFTRIDDKDKRIQELLEILNGMLEANKEFSEGFRASLKKFN